MTMSLKKNPFQVKNPATPKYSGEKMRHLGNFEKS